MQFDPDKDLRNIAKHGVSLGRAAKLVDVVLGPARSVGGEHRYRAFGVLDDLRYVLVFTVRDGVARAISLRRAGSREFRRYAEAE
jgi:uncharacterized DUF497 family protein